jgi:hypothetical protein
VPTRDTFKRVGTIITDRPLQIHIYREIAA